MIVGIDFDNTIVCYDKVIYCEALRRRLIPEKFPADKEKIRNYLRTIGQEDSWTKLQGYIYGIGIKKCPPFNGVLEFLEQCKQKGVAVRIISHKTKYPVMGPKYDLHKAAHNWLAAQGFYETDRTGLSRDKVHFFLTKQKKLSHVLKHKCRFFIDDLIEFLCDSAFPLNVQRVFFDAHGNHAAPQDNIAIVNSWRQISRVILG